MTNRRRPDSYYTPHLEQLSQALESTSGIRINCISHGMAIRYRKDLHSARSVDRDRNRAIYPSDHPLHGKSVFDPLILSVPSDASYIEIRRETSPIVSIEEIKDEEDSVSGDPFPSNPFAGPIEG